MFGAAVVRQVKRIVAALDQSAFKSSASELGDLVGLYGSNAQAFVIACLLDAVNFEEAVSEAVQLHLTLLGHELGRALSKSNFVDVVLEAFGYLEKLRANGEERSSAVSEDYITRLATALRLPIAQKVALACALSYHRDSITSVGAQTVLQSALREHLDALSASNGEDGVTLGAEPGLPEPIFYAALALVRPDSLASARRGAARLSFDPALVEALQRAYGRMQDKFLSVMQVEGDALAAVDATTGDIEAAISALADTLKSSLPLADILRDVGYSVTSSTPVLQEVISRVSGLGVSINAGDAARLMAMFSGANGVTEGELSSAMLNALTQGAVAEADVAGAESWNLDVVANFLVGLKLDWIAVARGLDFAEFSVPDYRSFEVLLRLYRKCAGTQLPVQVLLADWTNPVGQLGLLRHAALAPPELYTFAEIVDLSPADGMRARTASPNGAWLCQRFFDKLLALADTDLNPLVQTVFAPPLKFCPDLLLLGLARVERRWSLLRKELLDRLAPLVFRAGGSSHFPAVVRALWAADQSLVLDCIGRTYRATLQEPKKALPHVIHLARLLKVDPELQAAALNATGPHIEWSLALAAVQRDKGELDMAKWLSERVNADREAFLAFLLDFCQRQLPHVAPQSSAERGPLSLESLDVALKVAQASEVLRQTPMLRKQLRLIAEEASKRFPRVMQLQGEKVEEEASVHYKKMYNGEIKVADTVRLMQRLKDSSNQHDKDVFACMVQNIFGEYKYFHKYPEKELRITAALFGQMIQHNLVTNMTLGMALRYVLEALRKQPTNDMNSAASKMFLFGLISLEQFQPRLAEWPQYCSHVVAIPHLKTEYPQLVEFVQQAIGQTRQADGPSGSAAPLGIQLDSPSLGPSSHLAGNPAASSSLPEAAVSSAARTSPSLTAPAPAPEFDISKIMPRVKPIATAVPPAEGLIDRFHFIVNNLAASNIEQKLLDMRGLLEEEHVLWLADYLVSKRIAHQLNFHGLYLDFIDRLQRPSLLPAITQVVYFRVSVHLSSDTITSSTSERSILKHLGAWLGMTTLARNRPILARNLDLKELLLQGYECGKLIAIAPFVAKVLEGAVRSAAFRPPNPWTMAILSTLKDLHVLDNLKMNIKFEVELLCNKLDIKVDQVPVKSSLAGRRPPVLPNQDFNLPRGSSASGGQAAGVTPPMLGAGTPQFGSPNLVPSEPGASLGGNSMPNAGNDESAGHLDRAGAKTVIPNLAAYVKISPALPLFQSHPQLQSLVHIGIDRAIREVIHPAVERSVTIATITAKELVIKDFASSGDDVSMRKAAHMMVSTLAGSLAMFTCRRTLEACMETHLKSLLAEYLDAETGPNTIGSICSDNLELGAALIEKAAKERARKEIDQALLPAIHARRKHREASKAEPFYDLQVLNAHRRYPASLPEALVFTPKKTDLRVYDAFTRLPKADREASGGSLADASPLSGPAETEPEVAGNEINPRQAVELFRRLLAKLDGLARALVRSAGGREISLEALQNHETGSELREVLAGLRSLIAQLPAASREDVAVRLGQQLFKRMYEGPSELLSLECLTRALDAMRQACPRLRTELANWIGLVNPISDRDKILHKTNLILLVRHRLVTAAELDACLSKNLNSSQTASWVDLVLQIMRQCIVEKNAVLQEFPQLLDVLMHCVRNMQQNLREQVLKILKDLQHLSQRTREQEGAAAAGNSEGSSAPSAPTSSDNPPAAAPPVTHAGLTTPENIEIREKVTPFLQNWLRLCSDGVLSEKLNEQFVQLLHKEGHISSDAALSAFLLTSGELVVEACLKTSSPGTSPAVTSLNSKGAGSLIYQFIDAYTRLLTAIITYGYQDSSVSPANRRMQMLTRVLGVVVRLTATEHEAFRNGYASGFDQRPYYRIFHSLLVDMNQPNPVLDSRSLAVLNAFASAFHQLRPAAAPGFAFAWLELVSSRHFMPEVLGHADREKGWNLMHVLMIDLFTMLDGFLSQGELTDAMRAMYKGTLRTLLVLLHDFPQFLIDYHLSFCDVIPSSCIQMRNLILSAYPRDTHLPDPLKPNLKVDRLPEISQPPRIMSNFRQALSQAAGGLLKQNLDQYLMGRAPSDFLQTLLSMLRQGGDASEYDVPLINSLVVYVGVHAIGLLQERANQAQTSAHVHLFLYLVTNLDAAGRYYVLNAIANQLRYPNSHTHYFSCVMLQLFGSAPSDTVKEQITRVLLERLIVHRPHPWGLLITFIELIKNRRYAFWTHSFTCCAPEIERVFESVARGCMSQPNDAASSSGGSGSEDGIGLQIDSGFVLGGKESSDGVFGPQ
uniref:CCR4-NOT transcription complex subunit 1 n=1 Tax=Pinguiococcus pyrenoidosus TaxID=172671 RepID=A0A7R9U950_9STRA|mmetsp:Transcript_1979/g.8730  ORF Transcript_1979/g.8730 Transcript_1979/m.8730 type:complete len:2287 (+) Transcript_1979:114-6974(+)